MPEIIKIVGDSVQYIREEVIREVGVDSFVANIEKNMGRDTGILPRGCLYMKTEGGKCVYLIEVQAGLVPVTYKDGRGNRSNLMISIPFTQFYLSCNYDSETILNAHLTVTKTPLVDINQEVFIAPYLNIFSNGEGGFAQARCLFLKTCLSNSRLKRLCPDFSKRISMQT